MKTTTTMALAAMALMVGAAASGCAADGAASNEEALLPAPPPGGGLQLGLHAPAGLSAPARLCRLVVLGGDGLDVTALEHELGAGAAEVRLAHTALTVADAWDHPGRVGCEELDGARGETFYASTEPSGVTEETVHIAPFEVVLVEARFAPTPNDPEVVPAVAVNLWTH